MSKAKRSRKPRRGYDATKRQERARANQERILEVATRLFAERGYVETTVDSIAEGAGVAVPTVYAAFGSKRGVLARLLNRSLTGEPDPKPMLRTARAREVLDEPDPRRAIALFAKHMTEIQERVTPMFEVMKHAARIEPEIAELYGRAQRKRYDNLEAFARRLAKRGGLRAGLTIKDAGRTIWVLASPETRQMLEVHAAWSATRYAKWLSSTLVAALLPPAG